MATQLQRDVIRTGPSADTELQAEPAFASGDRAPTASTPPPAVDAVGLSKAFGDRVVLRDLDLRIAPGEFVAVLGRSGTGKSTLLRVLGALDPVFTGTVDVPERRAFVFQEPRLLPWKRVVDNVRLGLRGETGRRRARAALDEVGLADHHRDWPKTLSGGEAQRVALARALVREPELLLLDEPFGALDALTRIKMHGLLQELCRRYGPAVVLVTHDVDEALLLADRVVVLDAGSAVVDVPVTLATPRLRSDPGFGELRSQLLAALGIDEVAEGDH
jgi:sulfonate transport system ATP-binding protein